MLQTTDSKGVFVLLLFSYVGIFVMISACIMEGWKELTHTYTYIFFHLCTLCNMEESLVQLRNLIAIARRQEDSSDDHISVGELERRFNGLEEELLRDHHHQIQLKQKKLSGLYHVARRRHQQHVEKWPVTGCGLHRSEVGAMSISPYEFSETSVSGENAPHVAEEEVVAAGATPRISHRQANKSDDDHYDRMSSYSRSTCGVSYVADPDVHMLVDIADGSIRWEGSNGICSCHLGSKVEVPCCGSSSSGCLPTTTPLYSFAQSYAKDDCQRLLFIIDQLSHILREERAQKEKLLQHVIPVMVRHIETLERDVAAQRREITSLKRDVGPGRVVHSGSDNDDDNGNDVVVSRHK